MNVKDAGPPLTQQLVCPAVERLAGGGVLVLLVVLDRPEVSQGPHEAPEVHLVLSRIKTASLPLVVCSSAKPQLILTGTEC